MYLHIGITITEDSEVKNFYEDILGMSIERHFFLPKNLASFIFGINRKTEAYLMKRDDLLIELFINSEISSHNFDHICLAVPDRKGLIREAQNKGYECLIKERESSDLVFVKDKSGNIFEVKDK